MQRARLVNHRRVHADIFLVQLQSRRSRRPTEDDRQARSVPQRDEHAQRAVRVRAWTTARHAGTGRTLRTRWTSWSLGTGRTIGTRRARGTLRASGADHAQHVRREAVHLRASRSRQDAPDAHWSGRSLLMSGEARCQQQESDRDGGEQMFLHGFRIHEGQPDLGEASTSARAGLRCPPTSRGSSRRHRGRSHRSLARSCL